jgi:hypothetical protein
MGNVFIGAVKLTTVQKKQQLERYNTRLDNYFKEFRKLESIYEKTEKESDLRKVEILEKKISIISSKIETLRNSLPDYLR